MSGGKVVKNLILGMVLLLCVVTTQAQNKPQGLTSQPNQTDSALTAETRNVFVNVSENTLKAAREMPENLYDFTPADGVRTFRDLVAHIAGVQSTLCSNINGSKPTKAQQNESKGAMVKALADSVAQCQISFSELSAENANTVVRAPVGQVTHLVALMYIITHESEEYGQMSIYLRLNHLPPPTTDDTPKGGAAGKVPTKP
jgi:uncharacterized damage-inducible protein DinB